MADIELLPLPTGYSADEWGGRDTGPCLHLGEQMEAYARANVEHHTEKLRAEVEWLDNRADHLEARAERLEAALRVLLPFAEHADSCGDHDAYNQAAVRTCGCGLDSFRDQAEAALRDHEQEAPQ